MSIDKELIELARGAGFPVEDFGDGDVRVYGIGQCAEAIDEPLARFARLIAEECARVVEQAPLIDPDPNAVAAAAIREKFKP